MKTNITEEARCRVLRWFKGKACENAAAALDLLALSEAEGNWIPGASRRVRACLGKANVAINIGRQHDRALSAIGDYKDDNSVRGHNVAMVLRFSSFGDRGIDWEGVKAKTEDSQLRAVIDRAHDFVNDFATINALLHELDSVRPKPVFTSIGASRLVSSTLVSMGLASPEANVRVCPVEWERVQLFKEDGVTPKGWTWKAKLLWPEGTRHNRSRYAMGTSTHDQCHACGHAIKNPYNWVPLLIDNVNGQGTTPYSLWVGRDCAKTIFGVKMTGDFDIKGLEAELER